MGNKHLLVNKYLEQHSLVESNIKSFNDFVENRMQQIVDELNDNINNEEVEVKFGKVRMGSPNLIEADGSINEIMPIEAKLRNTTYSAPIFVELSVQFGEQADSAEVEI